jgi:hypothetical protein
MLVRLFGSVQKYQHSALGVSDAAAQAGLVSHVVDRKVRVFGGCGEYPHTRETTTG